MNRSIPLERLEGSWSDRQGLASSQVSERLTKFGPNAIIAETSSSWLEIARSTASDPMIWFLTGTAALFVALGDLTEAGVLTAALVPIIGMDTYLHKRTEASTQGLLARLATRAKVIRDGELVEIAAHDLVPGDLAIVSAGSYFPADGLILSGTSLQADESTLTGEALPVRKAVLAPPPGGAGGDSSASEHWAMAGTRLLTGEARVRIAFTGPETLYGEIARLSQATQTDRTPLQQSITGLVRILLVIALLLCLLLAIIRYSEGYGLVDAILSAVTLAVAALPEEFPVVFSFFLGLGVYRLAKRQALVRRAVVVENIGRVSCICTDKTGTLTEGALKLDQVVPADGVNRDDVLAIGATASRAETADPLDLVLIEASRPMDGHVAAVFPFTEDRLRETTVLRVGSDQWKVAMKGAPETVLGLTGLPERARETWLHQTRDLAATGHKVIGVATGSLREWTGAEPVGGYEFSGLLAFSDPVRPGVLDAVREAQAAGIRVIMITGDHAQTAASIARAIGIGQAPPKVIDGSALGETLRDEGSEIDFDVVARCTPSQKLALVEALRKKGELVAVTGDGVNDAPALRGADIGIAMGERGTQSAREVASIVLLDDNFATIVRAIAEGRQLFTNLRLSFAYLLMMHAPLVATAALIPFLGYPLLYLPIHIVWIELIIHPTAMLVFQDLPPQGGLKSVVRSERPAFFTLRSWVVIGFVGLLATALVLGGYVFNLGPDLDVLHARSMAIAMLVVASAAISAALTQLRSSAARIAAIVPILSAFVAIQIGPVAALLHLAPLHPVDWMIAAVGGILIGAGAACFAVGSRTRRRKA